MEATDSGALEQSLECLANARYAEKWESLKDFIHDNFIHAIKEDFSIECFNTFMLIKTEMDRLEEEDS